MLDYIRNIAVFLIVEGVLLRLVTNEDYKKMLKLCSGMIMIIIVLSPLDKVFGFTDVLKGYFFGIQQENQLGEIAGELKEADGENIELLRREYETLLKNQINTVAAEYGCSVSRVNVVFDEKEADYIGSVEIVLAEVAGKAGGNDEDKAGMADGAGREEKTERGEEMEREDFVQRVDGVQRVEISIGGGRDDRNTVPAVEDPVSVAIKNRVVDMYGIAYAKISISSENR